jgi:hypothetical protein
MKNLSLNTKLSSLVGSAVIARLTFGVVAFLTLRKVEIGSPAYRQIVMINGEAARNTSTNVGEAQTAAAQLSRLATQVHDLFGQFKIAGNSERQHNPLLRAAGHAAGKG